MQKWVIVDEEYLDYLRQTDSRVPFSNYGDKKYKPFFGTLFEKDGFVYVAPISHPQDKHASMKNRPDFVKIYIPNKDNSRDRLVAVVNLRYMFPMPKELVKELQYKNIDECRNFDSLDEKSKYIDLLKRELSAINMMNFEKRGLKLYRLKINYPDNEISRKCMEYKQLEMAAAEYRDTNDSTN